MEDCKHFWVWLEQRDCEDCPDDTMRCQRCNTITTFTNLYYDMSDYTDFILDIFADFIRTEPNPVKAQEMVVELLNKRLEEGRGELQHVLDFKRELLPRIKNIVTN